MDSRRTVTASAPQVNTRLPTFLRVGCDEFGTVGTFCTPTPLDSPCVFHPSYVLWGRRAGRDRNCAVNISTTTSTATGGIPHHCTHMHSMHAMSSLFMTSYVYTYAYARYAYTVRCRCRALELVAAAAPRRVQREFPDNCGRSARRG